MRLTTEQLDAADEDLKVLKRLYSVREVYSQSEDHSAYGENLKAFKRALPEVWIKTRIG